MEPHTRTTSLDARWLRGLVGTKVSTYDLVSDDAILESTSLGFSTEPSSATTASTTPSALVDSPIPFISAPSRVSRTWVITRKLSEREAPLTEHDVKMGRGSAMTVGKFLCYLADDPKQVAFMRIYQQIPITETEDLDYDIRARQAVPARVCGELECFKKFQDGHCSAVPRFLGHAERTQEDDALVPGGYISYLVWEKVPGEPLTKEFFWGLDFTTCQDIRSKFRAAYQQVLGCGVAPGQSRISKIIFDQSTGNLHISGFRRGWPIVSRLEWSEARFVEYGLAKPSRDSDWYLHPERWQW